MTLVNWFVLIGIGLAMLYTGLLFDPAWANLDSVRSKLRPFSGLVLINYVVVPIFTILLLEIFPTNPSLTLALLTLAALPCAPLVPALVTLAAEPPEWPLFVFLGFSLLSLLFVVALVIILANTSAYAAPT